MKQRNSYRSLTWLMIGAALLAPTSAFAATEQTTPPWAYPLLAPNFQPQADDDTPRHLPKTTVSFSTKQLHDLFNAYDWFPNLHPTMPEIVVRGRKPTVFACGMCHLPNGQGRPENASLAGLPAAYIVRQMADYKSGKRKSSEPRMSPPSRMLTLAKNTTDEEIKTAADYFSSLRYQRWIRVVESKDAPKAQVIIGSIWMPLPNAGREPLGNRIVELPENAERTELRDPTSGFIAYVPVGSLKAGKRLANGGAAIPCASCHGKGLKGDGLVPRLAGRSPSYLFRQLYDMRAGNRAGEAAQLMNVVVANLSDNDMMALAAYAAALP